LRNARPLTKFRNNLRLKHKNGIKVWRWYKQEKHSS